MKRVVPHSSAEEHGLRPGDVILKLGPDPVPNRAALRKTIPRLLSQDGVVIVVQRGRAYGSVMLELW